MIEGDGSVSLLSKFYFCDLSLILICRKSASSPFLLLVSAVGFSKPLAQPAGAALRVKKKTLPKRKYNSKRKINFASWVAVLRDSVPHTLSPGKAAWPDLLRKTIRKRLEESMLGIPPRLSVWHKLRTKTFWKTHTCVSIFLGQRFKVAGIRVQNGEM